MNRKTALDLIRIEVAKYGKVTPQATRLYIENRIGRAAFNDAVQCGLSSRAAYLADPERPKEGIANV